MPKSTKEEKLRWIKPILDREISICDMNKVCPFSIRSLKYWIKNYKEKGIEGLENKSTRPKTNPKETPIRIKERIIELRKDNKDCALKLQWDLKEEGIKIHFQTIQKIIRVEGLTRKYRSRKIKPPYMRERVAKGEMIEIDIKYVPTRIKRQRYYQFTAIDCATRWRYLKAFDDESSNSAIKFLRNLMHIADFEIKAVKTDNGSMFTNRYTGYNKSSDPLNPKLHAFDKLCQELNIPHYLIDPGKPQQNAFVERSHRTDQEKFYDENIFKSFDDLKKKIKMWNDKYNNTRHCGLKGKTPNQALKLL